MKMPDRIWAWSFHKSAVIDEMQGGWTDKPDKREVEYTRSDLAVNEWNAAIERHDDAHWTRPFAGFLWPLLAAYALWRVMFREGRNG